MQPGSKVEVRPIRTIIVSKYANDEEYGSRIVGVEEKVIPQIIPGYGEVIRATIVGRQGFGKEIKKNRWSWGMMWIVTFDEDNFPKPGEQLSFFPCEPIERLCHSEEITLIEQ